MSEAVPHGFIALLPERCTSCLICVQECPTWCMSLDSHHEQVSEEGARRPRTVSVLDDFRIDYGLCMYCGICVDLCPFDALEWRAHGAGHATSRRTLEMDLPRLSDGSADD